jgi:hypothetical protein
MLNPPYRVFARCKRSRCKKIEKPVWIDKDTPDPLKGPLKDDELGFPHHHFFPNLHVLLVNNRYFNIPNDKAIISLGNPVSMISSRLLEKHGDIPPIKFTKLGKVEMNFTGKPQNPKGNAEMQDFGLITCRLELCDEDEKNPAVKCRCTKSFDLPCYCISKDHCKHDVVIGLWGLATGTPFLTVKPDKSDPRKYNPVGTVPWAFGVRTPRIIIDTVDGPAPDWASLYLHISNSRMDEKYDTSNSYR